MADFTKSDLDALVLMPAGWFNAYFPQSFKVLRTEWRCNRLYRLGALERRLEPDGFEWEYRKVTAAVQQPDGGQG
jgi:hypothetical protein